MNRKLLNGLLVLAVAAGGVGTFTSCKDEAFTNDTALKQSALEAQIAAIREVTDIEFQEKLNDWIDYMTDTYSDAGFASYYELCQCAAAMDEIYHNIMDNTIDDSEATKQYVENLYNWMFDNIISASDWYDLIYKIAGRASSVEINQTYNPVFGSIDLPIGFKTTILATYMTEVATPFNFPAQAGMHLAGAVNTAENQATLKVIESLVGESVAIEGGQYTEVENFGNMGAVYATVNPSSNDFSADTYTFNLVNSKGELSAAEIEVMQNEDVLTYGYTRAGEPQVTTGIYKLNVNAADDMEVIDMKEGTAWVNDVASALKNKSLSDFAKLGDQLYKSINNRLQTYGVQVSWTENVVDQATGEATEVITNSTISGLDLAATVIKPLSYNTDINYALGITGESKKRLPTFSPIEEYLDRLQNKLTFDFEDIEGINEDDINFELAVEIDGDRVYPLDENGDRMTDENGDEISFGYDKSGFTPTDEELESLANAILGATGVELTEQIKSQVVDDINESIASINDQMKDLEAKLDDFNSKLDEIKNSSKLNYINKLVEIYNRVAGYVNKVLSDPNHYLQVMALYSNGNGMYHHLSTMPYSPVVADGGLDLLLTSYTGDIVVPSYQKYIAITKVNGQDATKAQNEACGEFVNTVLPGNTVRAVVDLSSFASGTELVLTYVSVDYHGECSVQNYYVTVK